MTSNGKRIQQVTIVTATDTDTDTSYLGEFGNHAESDYAIEHHGGNREYPWFNPNYKNYEGCTDEEIRKYCEQDYRRMLGLNNGDWCYIGVYATADVVVNGSCQTIRSGGLWGTESDSDASYIQELRDEQLAELRKTLKELGFGSRAISKAFQNVEETIK